ncbi:uncharacterized protein [Paramormyrops kingsleyae]|uniref:uncharacterized protein isoform X3 n=1 Tax=Paramormyrops kingsleyae TaxID=1676925 RepID=UPI003B97BBE1
MDQGWMQKMARPGRLHQDGGRMALGSDRDGRGPSPDAVADFASVYQEAMLRWSQLCWRIRAAGRPPRQTSLGKTFQALRRFILSHHRPQQIITSKAVASGRLGDADPGLERNGSWVTSLRMRRQIDGSSERLPSQCRPFPASLQEPFELTVNGPSWVQLAVQVPQKGIC